MFFLLPHYNRSYSVNNDVSPQHNQNEEFHLLDTLAPLEFYSSYNCNLCPHENKQQKKKEEHGKYLISNPIFWFKI
jgi:hypothetical protein